MRCHRCGLAIRIPTEFCPACGIELLPHGEEAEVRDDYYALFNLPPLATTDRIQSALKEAYRLWSRRANNSPTIEARHEAERKLILIEAAESILLNPAKRQAYDVALQSRRSKQNATSRPLPVPVRRSTPLVTAATTNQGTRPEDDRSNAYDSSEGGFLHFFGWRVIKGTVISVEPPYMGHPDFSWIGLLLKLSLLILAVIIIGPVIIGIIIGLMVTLLMFSFVFPRGTSHTTGCLTGMLRQMVGFFLTRKLLGPKPDVPVRDVRLRDTSGQEHLVRIKGDIVRGNMNVGDEVEVEGFNRGGTLLLSRGRNIRTRSEIKVRRQ
jgi:hypothetical protein